MQVTIANAHWETIYRILMERDRMGGNARWLYFAARAMATIEPLMLVSTSLRRPSPLLAAFRERESQLIVRFARRLPDGNIAVLGGDGTPDITDADGWAQLEQWRADNARIIAADQERVVALQRFLDERTTLDVHAVRWSDLPEDLGIAARSALWPVIMNDFNGADAEAQPA